MNNRSQLLPTLAFLGLIGAAFAVSLWGDRLFRGAQPTITAAIAACDPNDGPCRAALPDGRAVTLTLEPRPVAPMQPLRVTVQVEQLPAVHGAIDFSGVDMDMGRNLFPLRAAGSGTLAGEAMLPVCVRRSMLWEGSVLIPTDDGELRFPFRFESRQP